MERISFTAEDRNGLNLTGRDIYSGKSISFLHSIALNPGTQYSASLIATASFLSSRSLESVLKIQTFAKFITFQVYLPSFSTKPGLGMKGMFVGSQLND